MYLIVYYALFYDNNRNNRTVLLTVALIFDTNHSYSIRGCYDRRLDWYAFIYPYTRYDTLVSYHKFY